MNTTQFTPREIEIAREYLSPAAVCLMEHGFNPAACAEDLAGTQWTIGNAFRQGYIEGSDTAAHTLLDKLEAA